MRKIIQISFLLLAFTFLMSSAVDAQKFGYTNSQALLAQMPEVKQMNSSLEAAQKQMQKQGEAMVAKFQKKYQDAMTKAQKGLLTPVQQKQMEGDLAKEQEKIAKYEQKMVVDLQKKQQDLLAPILKKLETAIASVAKEGGYQFIFDASSLLHGAEAQDITAKVKGKLGI